MVSVSEALAIALGHHQSGGAEGLAMADSIYRQIVQVQPDLAQAWDLLGLVARQYGRREEAVRRFRQAIALDPGVIDHLTHLGVGLREAGHPEAAEREYRRALVLREDVPAIHYNLANLLEIGGRGVEAEAHLRRALVLDRGFLPALTLLAGILNRRGDDGGVVSLTRDGVAALPDAIELRLTLANALTRLGRRAEAETVFRGMLAVAPASVEGLISLGLEYYVRGAWGTAETFCRRAARARPDVGQAWNNLGAVLNASKRPVEAIACYRIMVALDPANADGLSNLGAALHGAALNEEALIQQRRAARSRPTLAGAYINRGGALTALGRFDEAIEAQRGVLVLDPADVETWVHIGANWQSLGNGTFARHAFERALSLDPDNVRLHNAFGNLYLALNKMGEARRHFMRALIRQPAYEEAWNNLGAVFRNWGRQAEAVTCFRRAVRVNGTDPRLHSNMLLTLCYQEGVDEAALRDEHVEWARRHADRHAAAIRPFANPRDLERRLKVGYVSPDLRVHAAAYFLEPMFEHHDHERFEITCYAEVARPDAMTERLRAHADRWMFTVGLSDDEVAARVRADGIDVLVDLAGHTGNNRLGVFARKPAPVQATWLGYATTTGMRAMDYIILDPWHAPPDADEAVYVEKVWRLPEVYRCYRPPEESPDVGPLPADRNGHVTFGSFNAYVKVTERVVETWAAALRAVPDSRLLIITGSPEAEVAARFGGHGVGADRLRVVGKQNLTGFLELMNEVDVALDPFPHTGGTTTLHSLWMGVPVVTLAGRRFSERGGIGILGPLGLSDLCGDTLTGYVEIAARLAGDHDRLWRLRSGLRARLRDSAFVDAARLTRQMEEVYRGMWRDWCARI